MILVDLTEFEVKANHWRVLTTTTCTATRCLKKNPGVLGGFGWGPAVYNDREPEAPGDAIRRRFVHLASPDGPSVVRGDGRPAKRRRGPPGAAAAGWRGRPRRRPARRTGGPGAKRLAATTTARAAAAVRGADEGRRRRPAPRRRGNARPAGAACRRSWRPAAGRPCPRPAAAPGRTPTTRPSSSLGKSAASAAPPPAAPSSSSDDESSSDDKPLEEPAARRAAPRAARASPRGVDGIEVERSLPSWASSPTEGMKTGRSSSAAPTRGPWRPRRGVVHRRRWRALLPRRRGARGRAAKA